jgi:hypothetical protein
MVSALPKLELLSGNHQRAILLLDRAVLSDFGL